ncbi:GPI-GlcNAc transferase complex [Diaporthe amygdali]|uniref:GPI-GlcNAc transferase complex n=1 Tax=Phomopsis amygdali TaxID=1214568 RepID=UPI0022FEF837|nr:GPI-GlcNAc transferase complex [Diaporthe amygdali]KAJ0125447.1 GPI-GlcNAc transferase complex [Diaporthe amygdali]
MLTTAPHLHVRRPSPTTAEFTVTTCPPPTLSLRILLSLVFIVRVLLGLAVLLVLYSTWTLSPYYRHQDHSQLPSTIATATPTATSTTFFLHEHHKINTTVATITATGPTIASPGDAAANPAPTTLYTTDWLPYLARAAHLSPPGQLAHRVAAGLPAHAAVALCAAVVYATTLRVHTTESLLVLRGLGIQTSSIGGSYLAGWRAGTRFIPTEKIRDVLINEAFRGFAVRYYLVVVVDGEEDVVVVFPRLLPGRRVVEAVWRGVRGCLWEPDGSVPVSKRWDEKGQYG